MPTGRSLTLKLVTLIAGAMTLSACTHAFQTRNAELPNRMKVGELSFDRPQCDGWYMSNMSDPPTIIQFTRRGHQSEAQILVIGLRPPVPVADSDDLVEWTESLPDPDKVVSASPGHGANCVRYHGRSTFPLYYNEASNSEIHLMTTDEDSLECIDPYNPGFVIRFIITQRSSTGGTPDGTAEAYAFLKSVKFEPKQ